MQTRENPITRSRATVTASCRSVLSLHSPPSELLQLHTSQVLLVILLCEVEVLPPTRKETN